MGKMAEIIGMAIPRVMLKKVAFAVGMKLMPYSWAYPLNIQSRM
jgi:hypothetical protein